jgi:preprotein translocase subunit YajC
VLLAENTGSNAGASIFSWLLIVVVIAAFYFLLIRPNNRRRREEMELQRNLSVGDEVRTVGGLFGTVVAADDEAVTLEAAPGVELRFARGSIARVVTRAERDEEPVEEVDADEQTDEPDEQKKSGNT